MNGNFLRFIAVAAEVPSPSPDSAIGLWPPSTAAAILVAATSLVAAVAECYDWNVVAEFNEGTAKLKVRAFLQKDNKDISHLKN